MMFGEHERHAVGSGRGFACDDGEPPAVKVGRVETAGRVGRADAEGHPREKKVDSEECPEVREALDCCHPWNIQQIDVSYEPCAPQRFGVWAYDVGMGVWPCPGCGQQSAGVGYTSAHHVFRCVTCERETRIYVKIPLIDCALHGRQQVAVPWSVKTARWHYEGTRAWGDSSRAW